MSGEFIGVWAETWREIWIPLTEASFLTSGLSRDVVFTDLYREMAGTVRRPGALASPPSLGLLAEAVQERNRATELFQAVGVEEIAGEGELIGFFESVFDVLDELGGDDLSNRYFNLLDDFIRKFSLRYELRRPCLVCPTVPGMFSSLFRSMYQLGSGDQNVAHRLRDYRESVQDLRLGLSEGRIASCVSKQVMLLEALGASAGLSGNDLGAFCKALPDSPHPAVGKALGSLYGFASDFPGLRHGTPFGGMNREVGMKDMLAASILLSGFVPYLEHRLDPSEIYGGTTRRPSMRHSRRSMRGIVGRFNHFASKLIGKVRSGLRVQPNRGIQ